MNNSCTRLGACCWSGLAKRASITLTTWQLVPPMSSCRRLSGCHQWHAQSIRGRSTCLDAHKDVYKTSG